MVGEDELDEEEMAEAPTFASTMAAFDTLQKYFHSQETDKTEKSLWALEKGLLDSKVVSKCQAKISGHFMMHAQVGAANSNNKCLEVWLACQFLFIL